MGVNEAPPGLVARRLSRFPRVECDPQTNGKKLADKLRAQERELVERTPTGSRKVMLVVGDKRNQNPINYLGTPRGAGDASLEAYFYMIEVTASLVAKHYGMRSSEGFCGRVSRASDETVFVFSSRANLDNFKRTFRAAYLDVRKRMVDGAQGVRDLRSFRYDLQCGDQAYELDLSRFSKLLRYPESVVSAKFAFSPKATMTARTGPGTLSRLVHLAEQSDLAFRTSLPDTVRFDRISREEIATPFSLTLESMFGQNSGSPKTGSYVEIRFDIGAESKGIQSFLQDGWGGEKTYGTRKGFAEVLSGMAGMRYLNTFCGHDGANGAVSVVANAMNALSVREGVMITPLDRGHLRYFVDGEVRGISQKIRSEVRAELERIQHTNKRAAGLKMEVSVQALPATDLALSSVRDMFILKSLGLSGYPPAIVEQANFMVSFFEITSERVKQAVLDAMGAGDADRKMISRLREIFRTQRTVRNMEDLIAILRFSDSIALDTGLRVDLERWFLDFAYRQQERISDALRGIALRS